MGSPTWLKATAGDVSVRPYPSCTSAPKSRENASSTATGSAAPPETAYRSGGGTAIYRTCPLERRLRDVHALQQHFIVRSNTMTTAGAVLLGRDVDVPLF